MTEERSLVGGSEDGTGHPGRNVGWSCPQASGAIVRHSFDRHRCASSLPTCHPERSEGSLCVCVSGPGASRSHSTLARGCGSNGRDSSASPRKDEKAGGMTVLCSE
jgi:hypothetical protein